ncbi:MAG: hypothetical protein AAGG48_19170 [Planctomycetota bacterium]
MAPFRQNFFHMELKSPMKFRIPFIVLAAAFLFLPTIGCGGKEENTVIQPSGVEPTEEERAEYAEEDARMAEER